MSKLLDLPSRKVFINDLRTCQRVPTPSEGSDQVKKMKTLQMYCHGRQFQLSVVWIQGTVTEVDDGSDVVLIDDGTGAAKILGCSKIPFLGEKIKIGQYVMVIGQLSSAGSIPQLRAIKVQNLSHMIEMDKSWSLEVTDQMMLVS
ncbi:recQ-mediated genome instability protein 2-like [Mizuhopecten yessoensis]|uniref:RecQ-mediated genome instability protein 2 n=1 Tax=Mizuhopecten yessoensis TaxID=6573 RepID=A0A210PEN9_MIZYE|nr:recQ-mediated genome instability protein 2-like [Mizuhopecten yessoensis]XP_021343615.1 recQ-mediated genome instability protein 2-like [Mizuhopecten yessoensis]XP_021343617.1 recQ-mediated genome instability protein 2-like [Mizuhopecten yessoensis]OWF34921.1 RecQ-mediated genome instability protein 2 [Mizuhopecten yessoensis]